MTGFISADSHVTEPIEIYTDGSERRFHDRVPRVIDADGWRTLHAEGMAPRKLMTAAQLEVATIGVFDYDQRKREQNADGVIAEVVFPTWALQSAFAGEPDLQLLVARIYNDWANEYLNGEHRTLPAAMIPVIDVDAGIVEAQRCAALGFRALSLPARVDGPDYNTPSYEPFWSCADELGLPLTFHSGTGYEPRLFRGEGANVLNYVLGAQTDGPRVVLQLAAGGVLDRHPNLQIVTVETGASWLAWVMTQGDGVYRDHAMFAKTRPSMKPSEFITRQVHATFMVDPVAIRNRDVTGVDCLMWGNDYPHPEGTWPNSLAEATGQLEGIDADVAAAIMGGNAARVFGFDHSLL